MNLDEILNNVDDELKEAFDNIDRQCFKNSEKVLNAFIKNKISDTCFNETTGYGYNDFGRSKVEDVFSDVLGSESSLVRNQFISGTHALTVTLFGLLRPNDVMLSISGKPYDTLDSVIGFNDNNSSLKSFGIIYEEMDLVNDDFNYDEIESYLSKRTPKIIYIQRSKGYSTRKSICIEKIEKVVNCIRNINKNIPIVVDNCYCEFVEDKSPIEVGANIIVGSLIKNLGAGIVSNGAYVSGDANLVEQISERLTSPGQGSEVGPSLGANKDFLRGLYFAPSVVAASLKTAVLTSYIMEKLGYGVEPKYNEDRVDIVQNIIFNDKEKLIKYVQAIQAFSPIDSYVLPEPSDMPGYEDKVIMASGAFTQGSSIELSCDGPIRSPYIAYQQGALSYEYGKIAVINAIKRINN